jgi:hypothetical protein
VLFSAAAFMNDSRRNILLACALSALAGYVDAIGFLHLGGLFVSFMSKSASSPHWRCAAARAGAGFRTFCYGRRWSRVCCAVQLSIIGSISPRSGLPPQLALSAVVAVTVHR